MIASQWWLLHLVNLGVRGPLVVSNIQYLILLDDVVAALDQKPLTPIAVGGSTASFCLARCARNKDLSGKKPITKPQSVSGITNGCR